MNTPLGVGRRSRAPLMALAVVVALVVLVASPDLRGQATRWRLIAWNNLGMHCMDADFSVFAILPPYNTIQAQLIDRSSGLVTNPAGIRVTYRGVADPTGSINVSSAGKTNFWTFVGTLFGAPLGVDAGLAGRNMPGAGNTAQAMAFDATFNGFIAEGIPITPYDDAGQKNYYPLMRITATDAGGAVLATTDVVVPVSDEMDCTACHASGSPGAARPAAGWVGLADRQRDFRLNILRLHDEGHLHTGTYTDALADKGFDPAGLYATATGGRAILCAACHASEALAGSGVAGISPLTRAMHAGHQAVADPTNGLPLESSDNRSACYRCHPGSETRCLRGTMGNAVAADGTMAIQCQNCHGPMSAVGSASRTGWLHEPTCQNCHTGTATQNSGAIRFASVFDQAGQLRAAANNTFGTQDGAPGAGLSLYRFSAGHGGLQCSACHGSTHAEYPASHPNDNLQSIAVQGHIGTIAECTTCHATVPDTVSGGPHGMHPIGATWVDDHGDHAENQPAQCRACHGADGRGTVLSRALGARTLATEFGTKSLFRGAQVSCYMCHNGPDSDDRNTNAAPVAANRTATTPAGVPVTIALSATDANGNALTYRVVSQPVNGTVGLSGSTATYHPYDGTNGPDVFTYAAWDGSIDSNLATVSVTVTPPVTASPLDAVTIAKARVVGCQPAKGKVVLASPAPTGGLVVALASSNSHAAVPATVTVKAGALSQGFTIATTPVGSDELATITATVGGSSESAGLTLGAIVPKGVTLSPSSVVGGATVAGSVELVCAAGAGGVTVALASNKPAVAQPSASAIVVAPGSTSATFSVSTTGVAASAKATIRATAGGVSKSQGLTVTPAGVTTAQQH